MDNVHLRAVELTEGHSVTAFNGENFSGRTALLRRITGLDRPATERQPLPAAYIGPEVVSAISGLASTVQEEIALHCHGGESSQAAERLGKLLHISH